MYLNIVIVNIPESSLNVIRQIKNESNSSSDRKIFPLSSRPEHKQDGGFA